MNQDLFGDVEVAADRNECARPPKAASAPKVMPPMDPPEVPDAVRLLLGPCPFRDPADQLVYEKLMREMGRAADAGCDLHAWRPIREAAQHDMEVRQYRRAKQTLLQLSRHQASLEILEPGYRAAILHRPQIIGGFPKPSLLEDADKRLFKLGLPSVDELSFHAAAPKAEALALEALARKGLPSTALDDQALLLNLDKFEQLDKLIAVAITLRDRALAQIPRPEDRKRVSAVTQIPDAELGA